MFVESVAGVASLPDLLRLVAVPVFAWAAYHDLRTRRVANAAWLPLYALGAVLLAVEGWAAFAAPAGSPERLRFVVRTVLSLGVVAPLGVLFWRLGGFGGADAKALVALAVLFPTYPLYDLPWATLPLEPSVLGVFSLTVLTNTVLVGLAFPLAMAARNLLAGHRSPLALLGTPVASERIDAEYGRLLETPDGRTRRGLDIDALRMYLRWRGTSLRALLADPDRHRDPASIDATHDPGDGTVASLPERGAPVTDGGETVGAPDRTADESPDREPTGDYATRHATRGEGTHDDQGTYDDPWGAAAFLAAVEGDAYGTTPDGLRAGLELLVERETVWLTPGLPFLVPTFVGLLVALTYGDLLFVGLRTVGLA